MLKISGILTINNAVSLGYPFIEAVLSVLPIVDEFLINDGGSSDDTSFYLKKIQKTFPDKIKLFNKPHYPCQAWESIDEAINYLISQAKGDWIIEVFGDEIWHEKSLPKLKKIIEMASKKGYNSIRAIVHWANFNHIDSYAYRTVRILRKLDSLTSAWCGDDFRIAETKDKGPSPGFTSSNVPPELVTDIVWFNLSGEIFPKNDLKKAEAIATLFAKAEKERQQIWKNLASRPPRKQEPDPKTVKQLPALIQGLAGLDEYKVREELFDKKFLKKLTGLNY